MRFTNDKKVVVVVNLSDKAQEVTINPGKENSFTKSLLGDVKPGTTVTLPGYGLEVWQ